VVPFASKALFALAAVGLVASIAYGVATGDGSATAALGFVAAGAFILGLAVALADPDRAPWVAAGAPLVQEAPAGGRPLLPSAWPMAAGVALGVAALAAATDAVVVLAAIAVLTVVGLGWLFQQWVEDPTYTPSFGARLKERLLVPIGLPLAVVFLVAVIVLSLSRVFLALPETATQGVALAVAVIILVSAFAIASATRMARTALLLLTALALVAVIAAGAAGLSHGERHFEKATNPHPAAPAPGQPTGAGSSGSGGATTATTVAGGTTATTAAGATSSTSTP